MHLNEPRERVPEDGLEARVQFYFGMLNVGFEAAVAGLMQELECDRASAIRRLAESYDRIDQDKLSAWKRQAVLLSRAG